MQLPYVYWKDPELPSSQLRPTSASSVLSQGGAGVRSFGALRAELGREKSQTASTRRWGGIFWAEEPSKRGKG